MTPEQRERAIRDRTDRLRREAEEVRRITSLEARGRLLRAGFGERHIECRPGEFVPQNVFTTVWRKILDGECLAIVGSFGRGKTQLACEACKALVRNDANATPVYTTAARLMETLKRAWGGEGKDPRDAWRKCSLLVIDDLHLAYEREANEVEMGDLLDARYYDKRATILIANLPPEQFLAKVGKRISSRINDGGGLVELLGPDRRGK